MDLITFNCSSCQQVLKVSADNAGKQAKCPRCGTAMVIPYASTGEAGPAPAELPPPRRAPRDDDRYADDEPRPRRRPRYEEDEYEDDRRDRPRRREEDYDDRPRRRSERYADEYDDDYERRPSGGSERKKWWFVRLGLLLVAISACVIATAALLLAIAELIRFIKILGVQFDSFDVLGVIIGYGNDAAKVIGRIGNGLLFGGGVVALVGYVFCVFVPNRRGTLALAIVALSLGGVNLIFNLLTKIIAMMRDAMAGGIELILPGFAIAKDSAGGAYALSLTIDVFYFAEFIIFALFLWAVGRAVRSRRVAGSSLGVMIFACVVAGLQLVSATFTFIAYNMMGPGKPPSKAMFVISSLIHLIAMLAFVGQLIWYILVLFSVRNQANQ